MEPSALITLAIASALNAAAPGPVVVLVCARAAEAGWRSGLAVSLGAVAAVLALTGAVLLVLVGVLAFGDDALRLLRWAAVVILVTLALALLRTATPSLHPPRVRARQDVAGGLVVGLSSPFNLIFFLALVPPLLPGHALDGRAVLGVLAAVGLGTFVANAALTLLAVSVLRGPALGPQWLRRAAALLLLGFAGLTAWPA